MDDLAKRRVAHLFRQLRETQDPILREQPRAQVEGYAPEAAPYGVALTSRKWIQGAAARAGLRDRYFAEHGLRGHHDVFAFVAD